MSLDTPSADAESIQRRRQAMADASAIVAISGGSLTAQAERLVARVVVGTITDEDAIAELLRQHS